MLFLPLISQSLPTESVTGPGYGPMVLILAHMIDSSGDETTGLALWLAVSTLRVTLCHQERKRGEKGGNESNRGGSDGNVRYKKGLHNKEKKSKGMWGYVKMLRFSLRGNKTSELEVNICNTFRRYNMDVPIGVFRIKQLNGMNETIHMQK